VQLRSTWIGTNFAWTVDRIESRGTRSDRYGRRPGCRWTDQVRTNLRNKLIQSIRRPSLAGNGLPERMRSTVVAFLGLTAAAGLALVAIFAQLGFPLLSPAPLPSGPSGPSSVSGAVKVEQGSATIGLAQAQGAVAVPRAAGGQGGSSDARREDRGADAPGSATPVSDSPSSSSPGASDPVVTPTPDPAPAPTTTTTTTESTPTPAPAEVPVTSPEAGEKPEKSKAVASKPEKPEATPAATKPAKAEAKPAKTKPVKAKPSKASKEAAPAPEASYAPAPAPVPTETGKDKEKEEKKGKGE
jgi:hypothetical protein